MDRFTPGPWLYRGKSCAVYTAPTDPVYQYGSQIFRFNDDDEPNDADLNLILAAPDLLEALIEAMQIIESVGFGCDCEMAVKHGRAAIGKAINES